MRDFLKRFFCATAFAALASFSVMAKDKDKVERKSFRFPQATMVNGTLLKAGEYQVKFDENTNELRILQNGKVKATTMAHLEARNTKARESAVVFVVNTGETAELRGVTFHGWDRDVIVNGSSNSGASQ